MKIIGLIMAIVGGIWGIIAFNMETSVKVDSWSYLERSLPREVNNIGLMDRRRNHMIGAGVIFVSGIILFGFGAASASSTDSSVSSNRKCPFCAEFIKKEAIICKHCKNDLLSLSTGPNITDLDPDIELTVDELRAKYGWHDGLNE